MTVEVERAVLELPVEIGQHRVQQLLPVLAVGPHIEKNRHVGVGGHELADASPRELLHLPVGTGNGRVPGLCAGGHRGARLSRSGTLT